MKNYNSFTPAKEQRRVDEDHKDEQQARPGGSSVASPCSWGPDRERGWELSLRAEDQPTGYWVDGEPASMG